jgi:hypothetical protein
MATRDDGFESFEDYGNATDCVVSRLSKWEYLGGGLFRLFLCKEFNGRNVLDHTTLVLRDDMRVMGKKFLEIAEQADRTPHWISDIVSKIAS